MHITHLDIHVMLVIHHDLETDAADVKHYWVRILPSRIVMEQVNPYSLIVRDSDILKLLDQQGLSDYVKSTGVDLNDPRVQLMVTEILAGCEEKAPWLLPLRAHHLGGI